MAYLRQYEFTEESFSDIIQKIQIERYGDESEYWINNVVETLDGIEDLAERYNIVLRTSQLFGRDYSEWDVGELTDEMRLAMLSDEDILPYIQCVKEKELPPAEPGTMYRTREGIRSFSDVTWSERINTLICGACRETAYDNYVGFFPLILEDDDGSTTPIWVCCGGIWDLPDNLCAITEWNGDHASDYVECPWFEWD